MRATALVTIMLLFMVSQPAQSSWVQTNGPSGGEIDCLAAMGGTIFAGSAIHGVYVTSNDGDTWNNYSNPFNPTTRITFGLKEPAAVSLRIYDAAGRLVRVLVAGSLPGGTYAELWDGTDSHGASVASGIYFYRLDAGSFTQTRKMVLLK